MYRFINSWLFYKPLYTIVFNVSPIDCTVIFDGSEISVIGGVATITDYLAGTYNYSISKVGYTTQTGSLSVDSNKNINITLEPSIAQIKYGYLYNYPTIIDSRNITNTGWHIPTYTELDTRDAYIGYSSAYRIKEIGTIYWSSNPSGTNELKFNGRGSGVRLEDGSFSLLKQYMVYWSSTEFDTTFVDCASMQYDSSTLNIVTRNKNCGLSVRPCKNSTTLSDGQTGTYQGNDGKIYRTICINGKEWLADNLAETKYRNGDNIPTVTGNTDWSALITGAKCAYDNDESNVFI